MAREVSGALRVTGLTLAGVFLVLLALLIMRVAGVGPAAPSTSKADAAAAHHLTDRGVHAAEVRCHLGLSSDGDTPPARCDVTLTAPLSTAEFADALSVLASLPDAGVTITDDGITSTPATVTRIFVTPGPTDCTGRGGCAESIWADIQGIDLDGPFVEPLVEVLRTAQPEYVRMSTNREVGRVKIDVNGTSVNADQLDSTVDDFLRVSDGFRGAGATQLQQSLSVCVGEETGSAACRESLLLDANQPFSDADAALVRAVIRHIGVGDVTGVVVRNSTRSTALDVVFRVKPGTECWSVPADVAAALPTDAGVRAVIPEVDGDLPPCTP